MQLFLRLGLFAVLVLILCMVSGCSCGGDDDDDDSGSVDDDDTGSGDDDTGDDDDTEGQGPVIETISGNSTDQPGRVYDGIILTGQNLAGATVSLSSVEEEKSGCSLEVVSASDTEVEARLCPEVEDWVAAGQVLYTVTLATEYGSEEKEVQLLSGETGPSGPEGPTGAEGPSGPAGADGETGPAGETGPQGASGAMGPTGATGPQGASGAMGPTGATGPQGASGAMGPTGATGPQGASGAMGPTGATGPQGMTGPQGASGAMGPTGATGPQGTTGPQGASGALGPSGPSGPQGPTYPSAAISLKYRGDGYEIASGTHTLLVNDAGTYYLAETFDLPADGVLVVEAFGNVVWDNYDGGRVALRIGKESDCLPFVSDFRWEGTYPSASTNVSIPFYLAYSRDLSAGDNTLYICGKRDLDGGTTTDPAIEFIHWIASFHPDEMSSSRVAVPVD